MSGTGRYCCDRMIHPEPNEDEIKNKREHRIGFAVHHLDRMIGRAMHMLANEKGIDDMTMMNGWVIMYLCHHRNKDVFQKDIEREMKITKSSVTGIVQMMEQKGYITRTAVTGDARLKKIVITKEGEKMKTLMEASFDEAERKLDKCLSTDEQNQLLGLIGKLDDGLTEDYTIYRAEHRS